MNIFINALNSQSQSQPTKRIKLSKSNQIEVEEFQADIEYILPYDETYIVLFPSGSDKKIVTYDAETKDYIQDDFCLEDTNMSFCRQAGNLDQSITDFFNIDTRFVLIYAKKGHALWRPLDRKTDKFDEIEFFALNSVMDENILVLDFICVPEISSKLNTLLAIG